MMYGAARRTLTLCMDGNHTCALPKCSKTKKKKKKGGVRLSRNFVYKLPKLFRDGYTYGASFKRGGVSLTDIMKVTFGVQEYAKLRKRS